EHYEVHVDRDAANDFVTVRAEARADIDAGRYAEIGRDAERVFKSVIGVSIDVTVQAPASLPRYELKAKRFFDHRPAAHRWQLAGRAPRGDARPAGGTAGPRAGAPAGERHPGDRAHDAAARPLLPHGRLGAGRRPGHEPGSGGAMIDWAALGDETVDLLRHYLMIHTTTPPGNEIAGVRFLADVLARDGIESDTIEAAPGRGSLRARLAGDGSLGGIVLHHHVDVVYADRRYWSVDPFGGVIAD